MSFSASTSASAGDINRDRLIVILGSGPGIGVGVASYFAGQTFGRVALISRNAERLEDDARTVREAAGRAADQELKVKVYAVDVADALALEKTLRQVEQELGPPEVVLYNAVRLRQTKFGEVAVKELVEDFQVAVTGLYTTAMWAMPHLSALAANVRKDAHPSFLITGGGLYKNPYPQFFALAMMKAAQVNLAVSLAKEYGPQGVHVGTVAVGGRVTPESEVFSPKKIAETFWLLYGQEKERWEEIVHIGC